VKIESSLRVARLTRPPRGGDARARSQLMRAGCVSNRQLAQGARARRDSVLNKFSVQQCRAGRCPRPICAPTRRPTLPSPPHPSPPPGVSFSFPPFRADVLACARSPSRELGGSAEGNQGRVFPRPPREITRLIMEETPSRGIGPIMRKLARARGDGAE